MSAHDYNAEAQRALDRVRDLALTAEDGWTVVRELADEGIRILSRQASPSIEALDSELLFSSGELLVARVEAAFDAPPVALLNLLWDESHAVEVNDNLLSARVLERSVDVGQDFVVAYRRYKHPLPLTSQRDTVYVKGKTVPEHVSASEPILYGTMSTQHAAAPELEDGVVRMNTFVTGAAIFATASGGSRIVYVSSVDYGGLIPHRLVNWGISRYHARVRDIRKLLSDERFGPWYLNPSGTVWMNGEDEALKAMAIKTLPAASRLVSQQVGLFQSLPAVYTISRGLWYKLRVTWKDIDSGAFCTTELVQGTLATCEAHFEQILHDK